MNRRGGAGNQKGKQTKGISTQEEDRSGNLGKRGKGLGKTGGN